MLFLALHKGTETCIDVPLYGLYMVYFSYGHAGKSACMCMQRRLYSGQQIAIFEGEKKKY